MIKNYLIIIINKILWNMARTSVAVVKRNIPSAHLLFLLLSSFLDKLNNNNFLGAPAIVSTPERLPGRIAPRHVTYPV